MLPFPFFSKKLIVILALTFLVIVPLFSFIVPDVKADIHVFGNTGATNNYSVISANEYAGNEWTLIENATVFKMTAYCWDLNYYASGAIYHWNSTHWHLDGNTSDVLVWAKGWYDFPFATNISLVAGNYLLLMMCQNTWYLNYTLPSTHTLYYNFYGSYAWVDGVGLSIGAGADYSISASYETTTDLVYSYSFSPLPDIHAVPYYGSIEYPIILEFPQDTSIEYHGYIYNDILLYGSGNYTVFSSGLTAQYYPPYLYSLSVYPVLADYNFSGGTFSFIISPRTSTLTIVYEMISINIFLTTGETFGRVYLIQWVKISTTPPISETGYENAQTTAYFLTLFILIFVPSMILGVYFGVNGFMVGLILVTGIGILSGLMPIWFVFLLGLGILIILLRSIDMGGIIHR